jgi:hypothetical protein
MLGEGFGGVRNPCQTYRSREGAGGQGVRISHPRVPLYIHHGSSDIFNR